MRPRLTLIALSTALTALLMGCQAQSPSSETPNPSNPATLAPPVQAFTPMPNPTQWDQSHTQEVVKVFSYLCIHCYQAEPAWKNLQIDHPQWQFVNVPIAAGGVLDTLAKIHYAAEITGQLDLVSPLLYKAYHEDKAIKVGDLNEWLAYLAQHGADRALLEKAFNSPEVEQRIERNRRYTQALGVNRTPTFVAFGKDFVNFDQDWGTTLAKIASKDPLATPEASMDASPPETTSESQATQETDETSIPTPET